MAEYIEWTLHFASNFEMQADVAFNISLKKKRPYKRTEPKLPTKNWR